MVREAALDVWLTLVHLCAARLPGWWITLMFSKSAVSSEDKPHCPHSPLASIFPGVVLKKILHWSQNFAIDTAGGERREPLSPAGQILSRMN